ncbi:MAG: hypothetical protein FWC38_04665 [Proteobacteria bacterium]|nr:hypothetical protein [Pseudomonadota bacterium]MCL2307511.1 hypothetical protein [Pseudomonadota bacterium]
MALELEEARASLSYILFESPLKEKIYFLSWGGGLCFHFFEDAAGALEFSWVVISKQA